MHEGPAITVKKSVFRGTVYRVSSDTEARALVKEMKGRDRKAAHMAFAFRAGENPVAEGMSDDGEPRGTAGLPLLLLLRNRNLTGVLVTVTRHWGGVKLGPGKLARAYTGAAVAALDAWKA